MDTLIERLNLSKGSASQGLKYLQDLGAVQIVYVALALVLLTFGLHWTLLENIVADVTAIVTVASWLAYAVVGARALARRSTAA